MKCKAICVKGYIRVGVCVRGVGGRGCGYSSSRCNARDDITHNGLYSIRERERERPFKAREREREKRRRSGRPIRGCEISAAAVWGLCDGSVALPETGTKLTVNLNFSAPYRLPSGVCTAANFTHRRPSERWELCLYLYIYIYCIAKGDVNY